MDIGKGPFGARNGTQGLIHICKGGSTLPLSHIPNTTTHLSVPLQIVSIMLFFQGYIAVVITFPIYFSK